jgi:hypothetical protein
MDVRVAENRDSTNRSEMKGPARIRSILTEIFCILPGPICGDVFFSRK